MGQLKPELRRMHNRLWTHGLNAWALDTDGRRL